MAEDPGAGGGGKGNFFTTLPGILTGLAAVLTASGTLAAVILTGGGNGGNGGSPPPRDDTTIVDEGVSLDEWAKQANAICERTEAALQGIGQVQTPEQLVELRGQIDQVGRRVVDEVRALEAPEGESARISQMTSLWNGVFRDLGETVNAVLAGDMITAQTAYQSALSSGNEADAIARELGVHACLLEIE